MIAPNRASSSEYEVSIRQAGGGVDRRADVAADRDAVAVGQAHVEDGDVGAQGGDAGQRLGGGAGLADDLDVVLGLQQLGDAAADDLVVVEQEHGDRHTDDGIGADSGRPDDQVPDDQDFRPAFIGPSVQRAGR